MTRRSFYTTFEVSQLCEVNPTTVQNWVNDKKLKAYVTPGGHRRIRKADLIAFMKEFGMPLPPELVSRRPLVLIVDDEDEVRDMLATVIRSGDNDLDIVTASGGVEALLFIGKRKPDVLILDIMMPGMNGIEVCRKLKSSPETQSIKIVAITGNHDTETRKKVLESGADLFYTKPLSVLKFREESLKLMQTGSRK